MDPKLPRKLAAIGIGLGLVLMAVWWSVDKYNLFHLPTVEQVQLMKTSYSPPLVYRFLESLVFVLLPGMWISVLTIHAPAIVNYGIWAFAVLLDGAIFYCIGLLVNAIAARLHST